MAKWWVTGGREKSPADARLKVVNIASMLSFQGGILVPGYTASKSGIAGITKAFANELAKERANFNAIAPGYIATENTRPIREDAKRNQAILDRIPEGRWGTPEDIAGRDIVPGLEGRRLSERHDHERGRRLAGAVNSDPVAADVSRLHLEFELSEPTHVGCYNLGQARPDYALNQASIYETIHQTVRLFRCVRGLFRPANFLCDAPDVGTRIFRCHAAAMVGAAGRFGNGAAREQPGMETGRQGQMGLHHRPVYVCVAQIERTDERPARS